jgi:hypothetical protein
VIHETFFSLATVSSDLMPKRGAKLFPPPSIFKSREDNCPQLFRLWSGISEVRTADSYGASEFAPILTCPRGVRGVHFVKLHVFTFGVPYCYVRYGFRVKTMFGSSLLPVCRDSCFINIFHIYLQNLCLINICCKKTMKIPMM